MSFQKYKKILQEMELKKGSITDVLRNLIISKEILNQPITSEDIRKKLYEVGEKIPITSVIPNMQIFQKKGIVRRQIINKKIVWYGTWYKGRLTSASISSLPFDQRLIKTFGKNFENDFKDFTFVYNQSGTCTAFLLRKILEKAIFLTLIKNDVGESKLKDSSTGKYLGLDALLNLASIVKVKGMPILSPRTLKKIQGIKFLGDVAAHNYLVNVDPEEITPQLPFITTALKELSRFF
jgi:hypothetical protein